MYWHPPDQNIHCRLSCKMSIGNSRVKWCKRIFYTQTNSIQHTNLRQGMLWMNFRYFRKNNAKNVTYLASESSIARSNLSLSAWWRRCKTLLKWASWSCAASILWLANNQNNEIVKAESFHPWKKLDAQCTCDNFSACGQFLYLEHAAYRSLSL